MGQTPGGGVPCQVQPGWGGGLPCQVQLGGTLPQVQLGGYPAGGVPCQVQPGGTLPGGTAGGMPLAFTQEDFLVFIILQQRVTLIFMRVSTHSAEQFTSESNLFEVIITSNQGNCNNKVVSHSGETKTHVTAKLSHYNNNIVICNLFKMLQFEVKKKLAAFLIQVIQELIQATQGVEHTGSNYLTLQLQAQGTMALFLLL